jgi:hypothetical protein
MKRTVRAYREISFWQPQFRNLNGWTIEFDTESDYKGQASHGVKNKEGTIYDWDGSRMPKDYIFHEMLHFAWACVRDAKKYLGPTGSRQLEEDLVQDICRIVFEGLVQDMRRIVFP